MLRKSSRNGFFQKDQNKVLLSPLPDILAQKTRSAPIFGVSNLHARLNTMGLFDLDSSNSPTSPLDHKVFSNPGGHCVSSPRSPVLDGHPKNTYLSKVGLGLVDSLTDEVMPLGKVLRFSESRKFLLGSKMGIQISGPNTLSDVLLDNPSITAPKSLPENYRSSLQTPTDCFQLRLGQQKMELESEIAGVQSENGGNIDRDNHKFNSGISQSETKDSISDSLTISNNSSCEFIGSLSISNIEQSEDYTCIILHGPNPRTTHIFGDCILESYVDQFSDGKHKHREDRREFSWEVKPSEEVPVPLHSSTDFLSFCYSCKNKLKEEDDIYIYRGEKAFCSCECRAREILIEEKIDKHMICSSDSPGSSFQEDIFMENDCHYMGWRIACPFP